MEKTAPNYKYNPTKRIFGFTSFFGEYELPDKTYIVILLIAFSQGVVGLMMILGEEKNLLIIYLLLRMQIKSSICLLLKSKELP